MNSETQMSNERFCVFVDNAFRIQSDGEYVIFSYTDAYKLDIFMRRPITDIAMSEMSTVSYCSRSGIEGTKPTHCTIVSTLFSMLVLIGLERILAIGRTLFPAVVPKVDKDD
jgi:hypothetical protein